MALLEFFPHGFYLVLTFKRYVYKFDSNLTIDSWVIAFCVKQLLLLKKKNGKNWISSFNKALVFDEKKYSGNETMAW